MKERIALIGCGLIGDSWAALMTAYGHEVTAWDPSSLVMAYHLGGGEGGIEAYLKHPGSSQGKALVHFGFTQINGRGL